MTDRIDAVAGIGADARWVSTEADDTVRDVRLRAPRDGADALIGAQGQHLALLRPFPFASSRSVHS